MRALLKLTKKTLFVTLAALIFYNTIFIVKTEAIPALAIRIVAGSQAEKVLVGGLAEKMGVKYASKSAMDKAREKWNMEIYEEMVKKQKGQPNNYDAIEDLVEEVNTAEIIPFPGTSKPGFGKVVISSAATILGLDIAWEVYSEIKTAGEKQEHLDIMKEDIENGDYLGVMSGVNENWVDPIDSNRFMLRANSWGGFNPDMSYNFGALNVKSESTNDFSGVFYTYFRDSSLTTYDYNRKINADFPTKEYKVRYMYNGLTYTSTYAIVLPAELLKNGGVVKVVPTPEMLPDLNDVPEVLEPIKIPGVTNPKPEEFPFPFPQELPITIPVTDPYPYPGSNPVPINEPFPNVGAEPVPEPAPEPVPEPGPVTDPFKPPVGQPVPEPPPGEPLPTEPIDPVTPGLMGLMTCFLELFIACCWYIFRLIEFILTLPLIEPKPFESKYLGTFTWFKHLTISGINIYSIVMSMFGVFLAFSIYKLLRRFVN